MDGERIVAGLTTLQSIKLLGEFASLLYPARSKKIYTEIFKDKIKTSQVKILSHLAECKREAILISPLRHLDSHKQIKMS